jgi:ATP-dependent DNA helicase RecQ
MIKNIRQNLKRYWGYDDFLPLQREAMEAVCSGRDCVVVLPTGGGKSLCYQVPAMVLEGLTVVVSPLISLMKDQVDALIENGVPAARLDSSVDYGYQQSVINGLRSGAVKILYLSPERLLAENFQCVLKELKVDFVAIDEAHCVSMWGHDFRPEYRRLAAVREIFGGNVTIGAYTATATSQVREDIAAQLGLKEHRVLVGSFDRPNLVYRVVRRKSLMAQLQKVIERHHGESGVVYCIRRSDVDSLATSLSRLGYKVMGYHAGMSDEQRRLAQDAFVKERVDIIVATIAFGMGIDKSNVRYVVHTGLPKSLENYQQESGRAGRDGLEAECMLIWGGEDYSLWKHIIKMGEQEAAHISLKKLSDIYNYCNSAVCRHKELLRYFGQDLEQSSCSACDVCLEELEAVEEPLVIAQKILSNVLRLEQRFGAGYNAMVLAGSSDQRILAAGHDELSTYGLLKGESIDTIRNWIDQLTGQGFIAKYGEFNTLRVTPGGWEVLKGGVVPRLFKVASGKKKESKISADSWQGVDRGLFDELRSWRSTKAVETGLPAYVIMTDVALRNIAKFRPTTERNLIRIKGIGAKKLRSYGGEIIGIVSAYCDENDMESDVVDPAAPKLRQKRPDAKKTAFEMFAGGSSIEEVARATLRADSTVGKYLIDYINEEKISDPNPWVDSYTFKRIDGAVAETKNSTLKSLFEHFEGDIPYGVLRIAVAAISNR